MEILIAILGFLIGIIIMWWWTRATLKNSISQEELKDKYVLKDISVHLQTELDVLKADLVEKETEVKQLSAQVSAKEQNIIHLQEKLNLQKEEIEQLHIKMEDRFANLAEKLLEEKSKKFSHQNHEKLQELLSPFKEKIKEFEESIEKKYKEENKERITLKAEINQLVQLNTQLSTDANNLVNALKGDNKFQGDWGEFQLEVLLQKAGLQKGTHFSTQQSFLNEQGKQHRPDFIIHLPDDKHLIIDSKVSLKSYEQFFTSNEQKDKEIALSLHMQSIKKHIADLSAKNYQMLYQIQTPDYLLMFIPIESALNVALQKDSKLFLDALDKNIVLVSTSTLLATMRTVSFIWKQERQKRNVLEIARQSGLLYDKFCSFTADMQEIGKRLDQAQKVYDNAIRKLSDSTKYGDTLIGRAEKIKKLGAKTNKSLPKELLDN